jgi:hypothetical protein
MTNLDHVRSSPPACVGASAQIERELTAALTAQAEAEGAHAAGSESLADEAPPA